MLGSESADRLVWQIEEETDASRGCDIWHRWLAFLPIEQGHVHRINYIHEGFEVLFEERLLRTVFDRKYGQLQFQVLE
jgi:hypothetical protein